MDVGNQLESSEDFLSVEPEYKVHNLWPIDYECEHDLLEYSLLQQSDNEYRQLHSILGRNDRLTDSTESDQLIRQ